MSMPVITKDACNEFKSYYLNDFLLECCKQEGLNINISNIHDGNHDNVFTREDWVRALKKISTPKDRIYFAFSMVITIAVDQNMFCHFNQYYQTFKEHTNYPKFKYNVENLHPYKLIEDAVSAGLLEYRQLTPLFRMIARVMIHEIHDYLDDHLDHVHFASFIQQFVDDQDIWRYCYRPTHPLSEFSRELLVLANREINR